MRPLSDNDLLRRLAEEVRRCRRVEADVVALIAEVDSRKLYAREACSSMFAYCTEVLHLSEHEAYLRIAVARAARKHRALLDMLRDGRLHLAAIAKLAPHLTAENRDAVLARAVHRSKLQVEELVAELIPRPDAPPVVRKLPARIGPTARAATPSDVPAPAERRAPVHAPDRGTAPELGLDRVEGHGPDGDAHGEPREDSGAAPRWPVTPPTHRPSLEPLAPARYRVQFTASAELREKLVRLRDLMRVTVPDGDLGRIIGEAVTEKLERLEAKRFARTSAPRKSLADADTSPTSRHVPAPVRRAVHERDGGRCTFRDAKGRRCTARDRLEFHHHQTSYGRGGDHSVDNLRLMCRTHNHLLAEEEYGEEKMAWVRRGGPGSEATSRVAKERASLSDSRLGARPRAGGDRDRSDAAIAGSRQERETPTGQR